MLFAYEISHDNMTVYSREPLDPNIHALLDRVEAKLAASAINNPNIKPRIFIVSSYGTYRFLSLNVGANSFAKGFPVLPTSNVFVNKSDIATDLVFRDAPTDAQRSLSGVIAHEIAHQLVRARLGYLKNLMLPTWKQEGYAEYVAGGSLLNYERGRQKWKANPNDDTGYKYFKYYMLVKYLIDVKKLSVDELLTRDFDRQALEREVLSSL